MLYVGQFRTDRTRDLEFWAVLWQGRHVPADLKLVAAYNLLSDLRIIVFEAESIASIRWLDRLNFVGHFECQPALDQTEGYHAAFGRDVTRFEHFMRERRSPEAVIERESSFRARSIEAPNIWAALALGEQQKLLLQGDDLP
jgi:hypothetical protein